MNRIKLFLKLLSLTLFVFLSACTQTQSVDQNNIVSTIVAETLTAVPILTLVPTQSPIPSLTPAPTKDSQREALINEAVALLNKNTLESSREVYLHTLEDYYWYGEYGEYGNDEEIKSLYYYAKYLATILQGDEYISLLIGADFSPTYTGVYHEQISNLILSRISIDQWHSNYALYSRMKATSEAKRKSPAPVIGMTAEEVKNSSWGTPNKINRTTTEYSVSEQWIYTSRGYIYLDDGIVCNEPQKLDTKTRVFI